MSQRPTPRLGADGLAWGLHHHNLSPETLAHARARALGAPYMPSARLQTEMEALRARVDAADAHARMLAYGKAFKHPDAIVATNEAHKLNAALMGLLNGSEGGGLTPDGVRGGWTYSPTYLSQLALERQEADARRAESASDARRAFRALGAWRSARWQAAKDAAEALARWQAEMEARAAREK